MSYWILAVLVASSIVVFEGQSLVDCPFIHHCCGVETRARGMEKLARNRPMCSGRGAVIFIYVK